MHKNEAAAFLASSPEVAHHSVESRPPVVGPRPTAGNWDRERSRCCWFGRGCNGCMGVKTHHSWRMGTWDFFLYFTDWGILRTFLFFSFFFLRWIYHNVTTKETLAEAPDPSPFFAGHLSRQLFLMVLVNTKPLWAEPALPISSDRDWGWGVAGSWSGTFGFVDENRSKD